MRLTTARLAVVLAFATLGGCASGGILLRTPLAQERSTTSLVPSPTAERRAKRAPAPPKANGGSGKAKSSSTTRICDQPNRESQVEVKLISIRYKEEECYRDKATPIAAFVTLRAENVSPGEASDPGGYISPYWRSPDGRRLDLDGCLTTNGLPESLAPGNTLSERKGGRCLKSLAHWWLRLLSPS